MTPRRARAAVAVLPLLLALGCNAKDDTNPVGTGGSGNGDLTGDLDVGVSAVGAMDFVNGFLSEIEPLASGDFSGLTLDLVPPPSALGAGPHFPMEVPIDGSRGGLERTGEEVVWSEPDQAWVLDATQTETSTDGSASVELHFAVQYRTASGVPQQLPNELTDSMTIAAAFHIDLQASSDQGDTFGMGMDYDMAMTVGGLPQGPYPVDGSGTLGMDLAWSTPGQAPIDIGMDMDWMMDMLVPADGSCPDGGVSMNISTSEGDSFSFLASYDAASATAIWTLADPAGNPIDSGTEAMLCSPPPAS